jgi:hypothetical protein
MTLEWQELAEHRFRFGQPMAGSDTGMKLW